MPQPPPTELEAWVRIDAHTAARVRICIVEEALPTPHERDSLRAPDVPELIHAAQCVADLKFTTPKPF